MIWYSNYYFLNDGISSVTNDRNAFEGVLKLGWLPMCTIPVLWWKGFKDFSVVFQATLEWLVNTNLAGLLDS